ncbi:MAG: hypothetical protein V4719_29245 [Planctomycetota bacterium]
MSLPEFKNEQEFRDKWIAPFLAKLGYINIKNTHGPAEQGKDFFFTDHDRFGHARYYAAQVKLGNIGGGDREVDALLDQVRRCFRVKLRFHKGAHEQRIAAVYVMTSGTISEQARVRIHDWCVEEHFGENVYFLDGEQLDNKDRFATYESDQEKRRHYMALLNEIFRNLAMLKRQRQFFLNDDGSYLLFRISMLEDELRRTPLYDSPDSTLEDIEEMWSTLTMYNRFSTSPTKVQPKAINNLKMIEHMNKAIERAARLGKHFLLELEKINQRYSLEIESIDHE